MEHEILKHSKKIFSISQKSSMSFIHKAKEVAIEIFIIVFAVTFSIWLHGVNEHKKEQKEVRTFLTNIRKDLVKDLKWLKADAETYKEANKGYNRILQLTPSKIDSMNRAKAYNMSFPVNILLNKINNANYEGFKSNSKIGNIENEELRMAILGYYQQDAPTTIEANNLLNQYLFKSIDELNENADKSNDEYYLKPQFKSKIGYLVLLEEMVISFYEENTIKHATEIIKKIDKELTK
jgi:hypothetical protein